MRAKIIVVFFVVLFVAGTVFAGDNANGCKLQGTWIGETPYPLAGGPELYMLKLFFIYHGTGDNEGTVAMDFINPVPAPGHSWSNGRGIWKKVGPNKYSYTMDVYEFDVATGDIFGIGRHVGIANLKDCNTIELNTSFEVLVAPDMTPAGCSGIALAIHRMLPQEPCAPE